MGSAVLKPRMMAQSQHRRSISHVWLGGCSVHRKHLVSVALIIAGASLLYSYRLGAKDLWGPAEGRTILVAREILSTGQWLAPQLGTRLYMEKPPLYHWLVAGSFYISGQASEAMARVPSVLAALATILVVYQFGVAIAGLRAGRIAAAATAVSVGFAWQARQAEVDMLLCLWVVLAYWWFYRALKGRWWHFALFHLAVGLSVMTKGLVGPVLVWVPLSVFLIWEKRWEVFRRRGFWLTAPLVLLVAAPWCAHLLTRHPEAGPELVRFATFQNVPHRRDVFYYILRLPLHFLPMAVILPWILALPWRPAADAASRESEPGRSSSAATDRRTSLRLVYCWFGVAFLLLSFWPSKQDHYLLPLIPALGLLAALALETMPSQQKFWSLNLREVVARLGAWAVPASCAVAAPVLALRGYGNSGWLLMGTAAVLTLVSLAIRAAPQWRRRLGVEFVLAEFFIVMLVVLGWVVPGLNVARSHKPFLAAVAHLVPEGKPLAAIHVRSHDLFYLDRSVLRLEGHPIDVSLLKGGYAIVRPSTLAQWPGEVYGAVLRSEDVSRNDELVLVRIGAGGGIIPQSPSAQAPFAPSRMPRG